MKIKDFYNWLLKRDKQKAEKLKIVCLLFNSSFDAPICKDIKSLLTEELKTFEREFAEYLLESEYFFNCCAEDDAKYLLEEGYITKERLKNYCLNSNCMEDILYFLYTLYIRGIFSIEDVLGVCNKANELLGCTDKDTISFDDETIS